MANQKETIPFIDIEDNIIKSGEILGISIHNIIQAAIGDLIIIALVFGTIPFVMTLKLGFALFFCTVITYLNLHGIKNRSVLAFILDAIKFKNRVRRLHLRSPEYHRNISSNYDVLDSETSIDELLRKLKNKTNHFVEENRTKKESE